MNETTSALQAELNGIKAAYAKLPQFRMSDEQLKLAREYNIRSREIQIALLAAKKTEAATKTIRHPAPTGYTFHHHIDEQGPLTQRDWDRLNG